MKSSALTLRGILEFHTSSSSEFLTLTYSDSSKAESATYRDFCLFMKRLRKWNLARGNCLPVRFLAVGEYGERSGRFHFHTALFNSIRFQHRTDLLTALWPNGFVHVGEVTPASVRYIAAYLQKPVSLDRPRPIARWSLRPALGHPGIELLAAEMASKGHILQSVPSHLRLGGRSYYLDRGLRQRFQEAFNVRRTKMQNGPLLPVLPPGWLEYERRSRLMIDGTEELTRLRQSLETRLARRAMDRGYDG